MSDYERHKGRLTRVNTELSKRDFVNKLVDEGKMTIPSYLDINKIDDFNEFCRDEIVEYGFYFSGRNIYKIDNREVDPNDDIFEYSKKADGTISYQFKFYNGGTCFSEQIDDLIEIIEDE